MFIEMGNFPMVSVNTNLKNLGYILETGYIWETSYIQETAYFWLFLKNHSLWEIGILLCDVELTNCLFLGNSLFLKIGYSWK